MMVNLGDGSGHQPPYDVAARPYNYSDMTGFNNRIVNTSGKPLKGYWMEIDDCGVANEVWKSISWNASLTNGCSVEVFVRANNDRQALANEPFVPATNNGTLSPMVTGRFIEVRLAMTRDNASKQPVLYDLTLHGSSSSFDPNSWLDDAAAYETQDAEFVPDVLGAGPLSYQWFVQYPWMNPWDWTSVAGGTNSSLVMTNVDSWLGARLDANNNFRETLAGVYMTDVTGESVWLGPAYLDVIPLSMRIPASSYSSGPGPAERYPATINVFGQPTNLVSVKVTLWGLSHNHSADLDILLVSPSGTNVMLISHVGGTNGVSNADLVFEQWQSLPPTVGPIPSGENTRYSPSNYGNITSIPTAPSGPYSTSLFDLSDTNPNGVWKLYIYDDHQGGLGSLSGSWQLDFTFQ